MDWIILIAAAFGAGVLNTIAGGGTFLTFPALVFAGLPPVAANATSAVAVLPGYLSGTIGFAHELRSIERALILRLTLWTLIGGLIGAGLLMVSSNAAFSAIVPFLLLAATLIFVFAAPLRTWASHNARAVTSYGAIGLIIVSVSGGYFNGGLGIVLLALFSMWGMSNIHQMNGLKNWLYLASLPFRFWLLPLAGLSTGSRRLLWPLPPPSADTQAHQLPRPCPHPSCA